MPGRAFGERRILLAEFIRESVLDRRGLAKALSTQLLENRVQFKVTRRPPRYWRARGGAFADGSAISMRRRKLIGAV